MVKIYSTNTCGYCVQAKNLYDTLNIKYEELNIEEDDEARAEYTNLVGNNRATVPLTTDGSRVVFGYNVPQLISWAKGA